MTGRCECDLPDHGENGCLEPALGNARWSSHPSLCTRCLFWCLP